MQLNRIHGYLNRYPVLKSFLFPILSIRRSFLERYVKRERIEHALNTIFRDSTLLSVAEFEGIFWVNPKSHIFRRLAMNGHYEPVLAELSRVLIVPGCDVIDIGANIGFFTVLFAQHTNGKVCSVEPTANALALLKKNIIQNSVDKNVMIFDGALSDKSGELEIQFIDGMEEYSSICGISHPATFGKKSITKVVPCITLEELVAQETINPGLIKMDVEGAEGKVLFGGWAVFEKFRPILISEFSPCLLERSSTDWKALLYKLKSIGYRLIDPLMPKVELGKREFGDLLAVPEEKYSADELMEIVRKVHAKVKCQ